MYQIAISIQILGIVAILLEAWVIFINWKGVLHSYLFLGCIATLVNNFGYLFELMATTESSYMTALYLSHVGRVWITFALLLFITELTDMKLPRIVKIAIALFNVATYVIIVTTGTTGLYYKRTGFVMNGDFPYLIRENGTWHYIWNLVVTIMAIIGLADLFIAMFREKRTVSRKRLLVVILAMLTQTVFLIIQMFKLLPVTESFDLTTVSFPIAAVFMFIAIFRYNLLDMETLAREYMIDRLSEGIIAVNEYGDVSYYNRPAIKLFPELGINAGSVIEKLKKAIKEEKPVNIKDRIYSPEVNDLRRGGNTAGTIYVIKDETDHFRYMAELEEQKHIADSANRAKSSFLANMSHEIRTPINAVLGMDEMILRESREKQIRSYAKDIKAAGRNLLSLINDILDFSKIEEGRMEILPTQYELSSVVNDLVNMIRTRAEKKGLKLEIDVDDSVPHILYGDEIRIKQIALNLLTNAVKYTNEGKVELRVGFNKISDEDISLRFEVSDTGIGMKEEDLSKLFSPFTRIEESRNRSIEGTGLGMSIVKQLLALMDSNLEVKSVYGEGSQFSFEIKQRVISWEPMGDMAMRFEAETSDDEVYQEMFHAPDAHILVVDDTEVNLAVIENLLKQTQVNVDTVTSGKLALAAAKQKKYDVMFIDHMMPDMDGIETLRRMKEENTAQDTVYIALTANAVSGAREMYLEAGFSDYLSKPVTGRRVEELLKKYLPKEKVISATNSLSQNIDQTVFGNDLKVLIVDDDEIIFTVARAIMSGSFDVVYCSDGAKATETAKREKPALILLDINLGGMNGFEVLQYLKEDDETRDIPVMFITADDDRDKEAMGLKSGALDFIRKPFVPEVLMQRSKRIISLDRFQKNLQGEVHRQTRRADRLTKEMMIALSHTVDAKDHYTNGHSERVAAYAAEIGRRMGKSPQEQEQLYEIGLLHDIGKIGIPEEIINKTERLTDEEFAVIKGHTTIGCEILMGITDMPELSAGARSHHEKFDGGGYPDGLRWDAIPEVARIICVADCYDAMTSTRTYSKPKSQETVREEILRCSGKQFDPAIAQIMVEMIDDDKEFIMNESKGGSSVWKGLSLYWDNDDSITSSEGSNDETPSEDRNNKLPKWIFEIPQIDVVSGIANCGSEDSFMSVLTVFHQTAREKSDEIEKLYMSEDIENYTIKVHALKSSARIIGAIELSDIAKNLEAAGKSGDTNYIHDHNDELLSQYRKLDVMLSVMDAYSEELPEMSSDMRNDAFQTIEEIAMSMDYGMMEGVLRDLRGYKLSDTDAELLRKIEEKLTQLDWDSITDIAKGALDG